MYEEKKIDKCFERICALTSQSLASVSIPAASLQNIISEFSKADRGFQLRIKIDKPILSAGLTADVQLADRNFEYHVPQLQIQHHLFDPTGLFLYYGRASDLFYGKASDLYYRMILESPIGHMDRQIVSSGFKIGSMLSGGLIKVDSGNGQFHVFITKQFDKNYIFIDSLTAGSLKLFKEQVFAILVSIGFITGHFIQNEGFYFGSTQFDFDHIDYFEYTTLRRSRSSPYSILTNNPHEFIHDRDRASAVTGLRKLEFTHLSNLVQKCVENHLFLNALLAFLEGSASSLEVQPVCYSVALEALTEIFSEDNPETFKPIPDKYVLKSFLGELKSALGRFEKQISSAGMAMLKAKIDNINSPTNRSKLTKPFELVGIQLTKEEIETIDHRNKFLHGNIPIGETIDKPETLHVTKVIFRDCLIFHQLLSRLILRHIKFEGKIVNNLKVFESFLGVSKVDFFIDA